MSSWLISELGKAPDVAAAVAAAPKGDAFQQAAVAALGAALATFDADALVEAYAAGESWEADARPYGRLEIRVRPLPGTVEEPFAPAAVQPEASSA